MLTDVRCGAGCVVRGFRPANTTTLKDWQPLMAALIALAGGTLAYRGAMAKVWADQDRDRRELARKRIGLLLRLRAALEKMEGQAGEAANNLSRYKWGGRKFPPAAIHINTREEVEEAWKNLELLPISASFDLDIIRTELAAANRLLGTFPEDEVIELGSLGVSYGEPLYAYAAKCKEIREAASRIIRALYDEIGIISIGD